MNYPEWHFIKNNDLPENYSEFMTYSFKSNEFTHPVLVVGKGLRVYKACRVRYTTDENFQWTSCKGMQKPLKFKAEEVIMWTFLPTKEYLKEIINKYGQNSN